MMRTNKNRQVFYQARKEIHKCKKVKLWRIALTIIFLIIFLTGMSHCI